jgi:hypothetical protein
VGIPPWHFFTFPPTSFDTRASFDGDDHLILYTTVPELVSRGPHLSLLLSSSNLSDLDN